MFWLRNKKNNFQLHTFIWRPVTGVSEMKATKSYEFHHSHVNVLLCTVYHCVSFKIMTFIENITGRYIIYRIVNCVSLIRKRCHSRMVVTQ